MLALVRVIRVVVGFIAVWQIVGLLPVLTNWLPNLQSVTGGMWAIAFIKILVMLLCGAIYFWLGRVSARINGSEKDGSEFRLIIFAVLFLIALGVILAVVIPTLSSRDQEAVRSPGIKTQEEDRHPQTTNENTPISVQNNRNDEYLEQHWQDLTDEQFSAGVRAWFDRHPEYYNENDYAAINSHFQEVAEQYPRAALGRALDMALARALKVGEAQHEQPLIRPYDSDTIETSGSSRANKNQFQCAGNYSSFNGNQRQDLVISGALLEISSDSVNVVGAAIFDGSYEISNRMDNGIGFRQHQDHAISGFMNRFNGKVDLIRRTGQAGPNGSFYISHSLSATCARSNAMF